MANDNQDRELIRAPRLFNSDKYSDVTIRFSGREIQCHKNILCENCAYFERLCGSDSAFAEATQKVIELHDDEPNALEELLRYIYSGKVSPRDVSRSFKDCKFTIDLAIVFNKYGFEQRARDFIAEVGSYSMATTSKKKKPAPLKKNVVEEGLIKILTHIATHALHMKNAREVLETLMMRRLSQLLARDDFKQFLGENTDIHLELTQRLNDRYEQGQRSGNRRALSETDSDSE